MTQKLLKASGAIDRPAVPDPGDPAGAIAAVASSALAVMVSVDLILVTLDLSGTFICLSHVKRGPTGASPRANPSTTTLHRTLRPGPATFVFVPVVLAPTLGRFVPKHHIDVTTYTYCIYTD